MAESHFKKLYNEDFRWRLKLDGLTIFQKIFEVSRTNLKLELSENKILESLRDCNGEKAPIPDGFNMYFQEFWPVVKNDVLDVFNEFHKAESFTNSFNSTFLTLIAKVEGAKHIKDFRPISLVGCIYMLIAKVLARRLVNALNRIIGQN